MLTRRVFKKRKKKKGKKKEKKFTSRQLRLLPVSADFPGRIKVPLYIVGTSSLVSSSVSVDFLGTVMWTSEH